jgi:DNA (cytosine-5)-methyltransferase 1
MGLLANGIATGLSRSGWLPEPGIGRVATGVPDRVNKLKALGNGLIWSIPFAIIESIKEQQK